uniref:hypothetical protein n=1 Tax=Pararhizobium sp. IMCC3301 TaxID=3067904 RepID=UPI00274288EB|nr:hypothetical protein [Pararhizobium sp. IMCC3301]
MRSFKDIDDVEEWLELMDYSGFWYAIAPFDLDIMTKEHCDQQIRETNVSAAVVLNVMKNFARQELTEKLGLDHRMPTPWVKLATSH